MASSYHPRQAKGDVSYKVLFMTVSGRVPTPNYDEYVNKPAFNNLFPQLKIPLFCRQYDDEAFDFKLNRAQLIVGWVPDSAKVDTEGPQENPATVEWTFSYTSRVFETFTGLMPETERKRAIDKWVRDIGLKEPCLTLPIGQLELALSLPKVTTVREMQAAIVPMCNEFLKNLKILGVPSQSYMLYAFFAVLSAKLARHFGYCIEHYERFLKGGFDMTVPTLNDRHTCMHGHVMEPFNAFTLHYLLKPKTNAAYQFNTMLQRINQLFMDY